MRPSSYLLAIISFFMLLMAPRPAAADEVIELLDHTRIVGKLLHYYDGMLTIKLPTGAKMRLPAAKVRRLQFKLPKPRSILSTPRKTFQRLRRTALRGDLQGYIDSHSTYYQMVLNQQVAMAKPRKFAAQLKKQWGEVQLKIVSVKVKGAVATMRVRSTKDGQARDGEFRFVRENGEWKMILPL
ncbi:MAG: hypothetical protein KAI47_19675 [Deltaproteobacteria bacterium]|nr:hypothetical protein [Deltaproteobacteria bacterium]